MITFKKIILIKQRHLIRFLLIICAIYLLVSCIESINDSDKKYEKHEWAYYLNGYCITALAEENNLIWIGTNQDGLATLNKSTGEATFLNINIPDNHINAIAVDENGAKWIGTSDVLLRLKSNSWELYHPTNSDIPAAFIYSIIFDNNGDMWIGTPSGLARFNDIHWKVFNRTNSSIPSNEVRSLAIDHQNNLWIGTAADPFDVTGRNPIGGLARFDGINWILYNTFNSNLLQNWVFCVAVDKINNIWIGTGMGLNEYDGNIIKVYNSSNSAVPTGSCICSISIDSDSDVWIGTEKNGIIKFEHTEWKTYDTNNSDLFSNDVRVIFDDININSLFEIERDGKKIPIPHIFKAVNRKTYMDIHNEMRFTQKNPRQTVESNFMEWFLILPAFIRRLFYWVVMRIPQAFRKHSSSVLVTAVGMFGLGGGWGITMPNFTLTITVGGIARKPGVVEERIEIREYLDVTVSIDHDVVDGAPMVRFVNYFRELIESGYGLLNMLSNPGRT